MKMRTLVTGGLAVVGVAAVLASSVLVGAAAGRFQRSRAGGGPGGFGGPDGLPPLHMLAVALDMTDAQQAQARSIIEGHRAEFKALMDRARSAQDQVQKTVQAPDVNEAAIRGAVAARAQVEADGAVLRAKVRQELLGVLSAEQRTKAAQLETAMHGRWRPGPRGQR